MNLSAQTWEGWQCVLGALRGRSAKADYSCLLDSGRLSASFPLSLGMRDTEAHSGPSDMDPAFIAFMGVY